MSLTAATICAQAPAGRTPGRTAAATTATPTPGARQRQQKVFDVKYADVTALVGMLMDLRQGSAPDQAIAQPALRAIAVDAYSPRFLQQAEELIRRYDVPANSTEQNRDVEIVAHVLAAGRTAVGGEALPADLNEVANRLKQTFGYTDVKLVDSAMEQAREGRDAYVKGYLSGLADGATQPSPYEMSQQMVRFETTGGQKNAVVLYGFLFKLRLAYQETGQTVAVTQWQNVQFQTDLSVPEGQYAVAGKSKVGTDDKALVLVVRARKLN